MAPSTRAYFTRIDDDTFAPTDCAAGAWREDELHLAPVAGLIVDHLERWRTAHAAGLQFSRFSLEVLGQIARDRIELSVEVIRPGRTIELVEATAVIGGRPTVRARGWLLQVSDTAEVAENEFAPLPPPETFTEPSWLKRWKGGMIDTVQAWQADDTRPGRARAWVTTDVELIAGEPATALGDYAKLWDTANGISLRQDPHVWMYPNVDLTAHLFRQPAGRWLGLDTRVAFGPSGVGLTSSVLHDEQGPVGTLAQSLTLRRHLS
ncbi:thioesterase family protein [Gordonia sp. (in: high G+C Gram-positive bacteria)]|uniref:thioesterase family protein n=1 Tax=unclassified Gordonia (in: high G+C Gram-positive bacteria) TaxID=2657482 RepID=UPI00261B5CE7|nr:thioesterase family protein [Gordonia sp. (in: high G+C Gram-positive bacteria)]